MWFVYTILSGIFYTFSGLISRHVLKAKKDAWAFSFFYSLIGAIVSLFFLPFDAKFSLSPKLWIILISIGVFIVIHNLLNFKSAGLIEASIKGSLEKFRLIWVFVFSIIILGNDFSWIKLAGTIVTMLAGIVVIAKFKNTSSIQGVVFALAATIFYAIGITLYSFLLKEFSSIALTFLIFIIPAAINAATMPKFFSRSKELFRTDPKNIILNGILGGLANLATIKAISIGDSTKVVVLSESFLIIMLVSENIILKEKSNMITKAVAVALALAGALLIKLS